MTLSLPLVTFPDAGTGQETCRRAPSGTRPAPAPLPPGRHSAGQPARPWRSARPARAAQGPVRSVAAQRRRRAVRPGGGRRRGQLHRPVPHGRRHPPPARHCRPGSGDPGRRRPGLCQPGHRAGPARPPRAPGPRAEPGRRRHQRVHECPGRRSGLAEPGHLGPAAGRLRAGQRHLDRCRPGLGDRPPPAAGHGPGRGRVHPAGRPGRPGPVAAAPGPGPGLHPGRVPRLGAGRVPGRPRPPRRQVPRPAPAPHPRKATKTARFLDLVTERHESLASIPLGAVAGISAELAPLIGLHPGAARAALRKAVLAAKNGDLR